VLQKKYGSEVFSSAKALVHRLKKWNAAKYGYEIRIPVAAESAAHFFSAATGRDLKLPPQKGIPTVHDKDAKLQKQYLWVLETQKEDTESAVVRIAGNVPYPPYPRLRLNDKDDPSVIETNKGSLMRVSKDALAIVSVSCQAEWQCREIERRFLEKKVDFNIADDMDKR
ncbi:unnamed protein product, partial [Amoebophrya sp. A25]